MIHDFDVRVWGDDVFIHGKEVSYWGSEKGVGLQCNYVPDIDAYFDVQSTCEEIRKQFIKLRNLLNERKR